MNTFFACAALLLVIHHVVLEVAAWSLAAFACSWPVPFSRSDRYTHMVVLADPQLTDRTSYSFLPPGPLLQVLCAGLFLPTRWHHIRTRHCACLPPDSSFIMAIHRTHVLAMLKFFLIFVNSLGDVWSALVV